MAHPRANAMHPLAGKFVCFPMILSQAVFDMDMTDEQLRFMLVVAAKQDGDTGWTPLSDSQAKLLMGFDKKSDPTRIHAIAGQLIEWGYLKARRNKTDDNACDYRVILNFPPPTREEMEAQKEES